MGKFAEKVKRLVRWMMIVFVMLLILLAAGGYGAYSYLTESLPRIDTIKDYHPKIVSTVYADDGTVIGEFFEEKRVVVPFSAMPKVLSSAFIAAEDGGFYGHKGISLTAIMRAAIRNIEAGGVVQGGSTITQQVVKSLLLTPERKFTRKFKEAILAYRIENNLSKEEILSLYLNQIYLGDGAYGVEAASMTFFGKHVGDLTLPEAAVLAGLPRSPSNYSPISHFDKAKERQAYVLDRMAEDKYITREEAAAAKEAPLTIRKKDELNKFPAPYYAEHIRRYVSEKYGNDRLLHEGLKIYTPLNIKMQESAEKAIADGLREVDKRQGYRGPIRKLKPEEIEEYLKKVQAGIDAKPLQKDDNLEAVVEKVDPKGKGIIVRIGTGRGRIDPAEMEWTGGYKFKAADVVLLRVKGINPKTSEVLVSLDQAPEIQGALLAMEPETGNVRAMVGGIDYKNSEFNRAVQSRRQPGSSFKPILYAAALDKGFTPASIILDTPEVFAEALKGHAWKPKNFDARFHGPTPFREALVHSRNVISVKILKDIGVDYLIEYASNLGIKSPLARDFSLALGSSGVTLLEITGAYGVFAHSGKRAEPLFVTRIEDRDGNVIEENKPVVTDAISRSTAFIMTNMMEDVVQRGTGQVVKALGRPAAGKTGTTNDLSDAWFIGYIPDLVAGVWVGNDQLKPLGPHESGGRAAAPIWLKFMQGAVVGIPVRGFSTPDDVVFVKIDRKTGLLAPDDSQNTAFECFKQGTEPTEGAKTDDVKSSDLFRMEAGAGDDSAEPPVKTSSPHELE